MAQKVIVFRNSEYLIDEETSDYSPKDILLRFPSRGESASMILKNFVKVKLTHPKKDFTESNYITTTYKDIEINKLYGGGMEQVLSCISAFKNYSISALDDIIKKIEEEENNKSISTLEKRIKELEAEKCKLEDEVKELKEIKDSAYKIIEYAEIFKNAIESTNKVES